MRINFDEITKAAQQLAQAIRTGLAKPEEVSTAPLDTPAFPQDNSRPSDPVFNPFQPVQSDKPYNPDVAIPGNEKAIQDNIEYGAMAAVRATHEMGYKPISSGFDEENKFGWVIAENPETGGTIRIEAPPDPEDFPWPIAARIQYGAYPKVDPAVKAAEEAQIPVDPNLDDPELYTPLAAKIIKPDTIQRLKDTADELGLGLKLPLEPEVESEVPGAQEELSQPPRSLTEDEIRAHIAKLPRSLIDRAAALEKKGAPQSEIRNLITLGIQQRLRDEARVLGATPENPAPLDLYVKTGRTEDVLTGKIDINNINIEAAKGNLRKQLAGALGIPEEISQAQERLLDQSIPLKQTIRNTKGGFLDPDLLEAAEGIIAKEAYWERLYKERLRSSISPFGVPFLDDVYADVIVPGVKALGRGVATATFGLIDIEGEAAKDPALARSLRQQEEATSVWGRIVGKTTEGVAQAAGITTSFAGTGVVVKGIGAATKSVPILGHTVRLASTPINFAANEVAHQLVNNIKTGADIDHLLRETAVNGAKSGITMGLLGMGNKLLLAGMDPSKTKAFVESMLVGTEFMALMHPEMFEDPVFLMSNLATFGVIGAKHYEPGVVKSGMQALRLTPEWSAQGLEQISPTLAARVAAKPEVAKSPKAIKKATEAEVKKIGEIIENPHNYSTAEVASARQITNELTSSRILAGLGLPFFEGATVSDLGITTGAITILTTTRKTGQILGAVTSLAPSTLNLSRFIRQGGAIFQAGFKAAQIVDFLFDKTGLNKLEETVKKTISETRVVKGIKSFGSRISENIPSLVTARGRGGEEFARIIREADAEIRNESATWLMVDAEVLRKIPAEERAKLANELATSGTVTHDSVSRRGDDGKLIPTKAELHGFLQDRLEIEYPTTKKNGATEITRRTNEVIKRVLANKRLGLHPERGLDQDQRQIWLEALAAPGETFAKEINIGTMYELVTSEISKFVRDVTLGQLFRPVEDNPNGFIINKGRSDRPLVRTTVERGYSKLEEADIKLAQEIFSAELKDGESLYIRNDILKDINGLQQHIRGAGKTFLSFLSDMFRTAKISYSPKSAINDWIGNQFFMYWDGGAELVSKAWGYAGIGISTNKAKPPTVLEMLRLGPKIKASDFTDVVTESSIREITSWAKLGANDIWNPEKWQDLKTLFSDSSAIQKLENGYTSKFFELFDAQTQEAYNKKFGKGKAKGALLRDYILSRLAYDTGVLGTTFTDVELKQFTMTDDVSSVYKFSNKAAFAALKGIENLRENVKEIAQVEEAQRMRALPDNLTKGGAWLYHMLDGGMTPAQAAERIAQKYPNYGQIPSAYRNFGRITASIGANFTTEAIRIGTGAVRDNPVRFAASMILPFVLWETWQAAGITDISDEELREMRKKYGYFSYPLVNDVYLDLNNSVPLADVFSKLLHSQSGFGRPGAFDTGKPGVPADGLTEEILFTIEPFWNAYADGFLVDAILLLKGLKSAETGSPQRISDEDRISATFKLFEPGIMSQIRKGSDSFLPNTRIGKKRPDISRTAQLLQTIVNTRAMSPEELSRTFHTLNNNLEEIDKEMSRRIDDAIDSRNNNVEIDKEKISKSIDVSNKKSFRVYEQLKELQGAVEQHLKRNPDRELQLIMQVLRQINLNRVRQLQQMAKQQNMQRLK